MKDLIAVALRQTAVYVPGSTKHGHKASISRTTAELVSRFAKLGFTVSEDLLVALDNAGHDFQSLLHDEFQKIYGTERNWAPLVKGWDIPTGESWTYHVVTWFANLFQSNGTRLTCGHIIPENTFPLERYTGCPFCGAPFELATTDNYGQGSKLRILRLWRDEQANQYLQGLLQSATAPDATQVSSIKKLLKSLGVPDMQPKMKEIAILMIDELKTRKQSDKAQVFISSPADIMRYLWYKHTDHLQIVEPRIMLAKARTLAKRRRFHVNDSVIAKPDTQATLKLKYNREDCAIVAKWLNNLEGETAALCEIMHPRREMWVRFIRALRLAEYSKKKGFAKLRELLDKFYRQDYPVFMGEVESARIKYDAQRAMSLLQSRPGLFARSLFANMLWFGADVVVPAFTAIIDKVPLRLLFTLDIYAENYFDPKAARIVKPLGGSAKSIGPNHLLAMYTEDDLKKMQAAVRDLCRIGIRSRFAMADRSTSKVYIDPLLFNIPLPIGDRSETIHDIGGALQGTSFDIEGNAVRLFMHWGTGLPAQHMDMDLSCTIGYDPGVQYCSYFNLNATGAKHSGDIRSIPHEAGTAEYIELDLDALQRAGAKYVSFSCNAYSHSQLSLNLVVGWMESRYPMHISETTGVAYDPSCVQHRVRVAENMSGGLLFGILDVSARKVTWIEMPLTGRTVDTLDMAKVELLLKKLRSKITIGEMLKLRADAMEQEITGKPEDADEAFTIDWAQNQGAVSAMLGV